MNSSRLEGKTVRPGSLGAYSYYRSARRPDPPRKPVASFIPSRPHKLIPKKLVLTVAVIAALVGLPLLFGGRHGDNVANKQPSSAAPAPAAAVVQAPAKKINHCEGNTHGKLLLITISERRMWACEREKSKYDAPVITGMNAYDATVTPPGTYHIYAKQKDTVLTGSDAGGSWRDPVSYWMPFLDNQHGTYGFHDATWRKDKEFGNVSPDSPDASHGCVELPLDAAAWVYDWAPVGTPVKIES